MREPPLEERARESRRGRAARVSEQRTRGQLNQGATPDDGLESLRRRLKGRIPLGMGERESKALGRKLEENVFESGRNRPVRRLEQDVTPA